MKKDNNLKKPIADSPDSNQSSSTPKALPTKINFKKIIIIFLILYIVVISIILAVFLLGNKVLEKSVGGFDWCKNGSILKLKDATLTAVGLEDYQSKKFEGKVCHLIFAQTDLQTDYYFDEQALAMLRGSKDKDAGNGCLVYQIKNIKEKTELCFGEKVKSYQDEEEKTEEKESELPDEFKEIFESVPISTSTPSSQTTVTPQTIKTGSFAGTKWRYQIDVGGGVGGVMTFEKDDNGTLSGTFTEFGPLGEREKYFVGSYDEDKFLLTLEEFPPFKIILSADGKRMTGKPLEQSKDIYYPDDFFKATKE